MGENHRKATTFQFLKPGRRSMDALMFVNSGAFQTLTDTFKFRDSQTKSNKKVYTCIVRIYIYYKYQYMRVCYVVRTTKKSYDQYLHQRRPPKVQQVVNLFFRSRVLFSKSMLVSYYYYYHYYITTIFTTIFTTTTTTTCTI